MGRFSAWVEVYSIDEAFLGVSGTLEELQALGEKIRAEVFRLTGLPVCVGIAKSKTLAKMANKTAKHIKELAGVCVWDRAPTQTTENLLARLPVVEVWGIGPRLTKRLRGLGIWTIKDLRDTDEVRIRDKFSIVQMRTALELRGIPCIPMEEERVIKDQLIFSYVVLPEPTFRSGPPVIRSARMEPAWLTRVELRNYGQKLRQCRIRRSLAEEARLVFTQT